MNVLSGGNFDILIHFLFHSNIKMLSREAWSKVEFPNHCFQVFSNHMYTHFPPDNVDLNGVRLNINLVFSHKKLEFPSELLPIEL